MGEWLFGVWHNGALLTLGFVIAAERPKSVVEGLTALLIAALWPAFLIYVAWPRRNPSTGESR